MDKSESKTLLKPESRHVGQVSLNKCVKKDDNEHEWWASDSGSSTGSYYSDSDRYYL